MISDEYSTKATEILHLVLDEPLIITSSQKELLEMLLVCLLVKGHIIIDGFPGSDETEILKNFANKLNWVYRRIQITADLWPPDILGSVQLGHDREFVFVPGPIFSNFLLVDKINYASPRLQTAFFEVLQEGKITVGDSTYIQVDPFIFCATYGENTRDHAFELNSSILNKFLVKISLGFPSFEELFSYTKKKNNNTITNQPLIKQTDIKMLQAMVNDISVSEYNLKIITKIIYSSWDKSQFTSNYLSAGLPIQSSIELKKACQAYALLNGRDKIDFSDIEKLSNFVLPHRLTRNYKAEAEGINELTIIKILLDNSKS